MLHLAQVKKNVLTGGMELELLASERVDKIWVYAGKTELVPLSEEESLRAEGLLVLVERGEDGKIIKVHNAKNWVLDFVKDYLSEAAITPTFVEQERQKVEQWRQEIAVESQELSCRRLEVETRRDELQELEKRILQEKEELENMNRR